MKKSKLTKKQEYNYRVEFNEEGDPYLMIVNINYDDHCNNGHNSFHITGTIYFGNKEIEENAAACGCIHNEIAKYAPKFANLIKWHGFTSEGPLYYIENTTYHARNTSVTGKKVGEAISFEERLAFKNSPFSFREHRIGFFDYIKNKKSFDKETIVEIQYDDDDRLGYTLSGFDVGKKKWSKAPFSSRRQGEEMLQALRYDEPYFIETPIKWVVAVKPDIEAARSCAIWPDATAEQLRDEDQLNKRLPGLIDEFILAIKQVGFTF